MNIIKSLFKNKNKPYYGKEANETYENLFSYNLNENLDNDQIVYGIIQEIGDGSGNVVSGIYYDNSFKNIRNDGKISEFEIKNIPNFRFLNNKKKVFKLCEENFNEILEFESGKQSFLKKRGIRITFLTSKGIYFKEGQFNDFNSGAWLASTSSLFLNIVSVINQKKGKELLKN
tara:strand:+ start:817 stop:1338 length:522 start_codon:yes stop_codon:yes gene_type:complete